MCDVCLESLSKKGKVILFTDEIQTVTFEPKMIGWCRENRVFWCHSSIK